MINARTREIQVRFWYLKVYTGTVLVLETIRQVPFWYLYRSFRYVFGICIG